MEVVKEVPVDKIVEVIKEIPIEVIKEVPVEHIIEVIKEVPVDKIVYKQHWWQNALSWIGGLCSLGLLTSLIINIRK